MENVEIRVSIEVRQGNFLDTVLARHSIADTKKRDFDKIINDVHTMTATTSSRVLTEIGLHRDKESDNDASADS